MEVSALICESAAAYGIIIGAVGCLMTFFSVVDILFRLPVLVSD